MLEQTSGTIVNIASIYGIVGAPMGPAYVAAKHGVVGLTRSTGAGVRRPCDFVRTRSAQEPSIPGSFKRCPPTYFDAVIAAHPMHRVGTPDEVAELVAFLASKTQQFLHGRVLRRRRRLHGELTIRPQGAGRWQALAALA